MIDIHCHILPDTDDGPKNMQESIEMVIAFKQLGVNKIISTPHYFDDAKCKSSQTNQNTLDVLNNELNKKGIESKIILGNEVKISPNILEWLEQSEITTLNNSRYLLIELPWVDIPVFTEKLLHKLRLNGINPVIAHPERNKKISENPNILYEYIMQGCLVQFNISSLSGKYGKKVKNAAELFVRHNMVHFVGTDAHSKEDVISYTHKGLNKLSNMVEKDVFNKLTYQNAENIIQNKLITTDEPIKFK